MLRIRFDTEDWLEHLIGDIDVVESVLGVSQDLSNYDDIADEWCEATLDHLKDAGIGYERAHQQSVGSFVLLQRGGTDAEREAFDTALEYALKKIQPRLHKEVLAAKALAEEEEAK